MVLELARFQAVVVVVPLVAAVASLVNVCRVNVCRANVYRAVNCCKVVNGCKAVVTVAAIHHAMVVAETVSLETVSVETVAV